jgi:ABC-type glycerol-3-phosphate transport system permease component
MGNCSNYKEAKMRYIIFLIILALLLTLFTLVYPAIHSVSAQDETTPTPTLTSTPNAFITVTYGTAYEHYLTVAQKNYPTVIFSSVLCGVVLLVGLVVGMVAILGRKK